jgi:hypothetical protein
MNLWDTTNTKPSNHQNETKIGNQCIIDEHTFRVYFIGLKFKVINMIDLYLDP